jgi:hypothetical protein
MSSSARWASYDWASQRSASFNMAAVGGDEPVLGVAGVPNAAAALAGRPLGPGSTLAGVSGLERPAAALDELRSPPRLMGSMAVPAQAATVRHTLAVHAARSVRNQADFMRAHTSEARPHGP